MIDDIYSLPIKECFNNIHCFDGRFLDLFYTLHAIKNHLENENDIEHIKYLVNYHLQDYPNIDFKEKYVDVYKLQEKLQTIYDFDRDYKSSSGIFHSVNIIRQYDYLMNFFLNVLPDKVHSLFDDVEKIALKEEYDRENIWVEIHLSRQIEYHDQHKIEKPILDWIHEKQTECYDRFMVVFEYPNMWFSNDEELEKLEDEEIAGYITHDVIKSDWKALKAALDDDIDDDI